MRALLAAVAGAIALLGGCATPTPLPTPVAIKRTVDVAGTLATAGSCEINVAAEYTQLALARSTAARRLDAGRLSVDIASAIQRQADIARRELDRACRTGKLDEHERDEARAAITRLNRLLELNR